MRLTLRTLLAHLDRILDEQDSVELAQKIQDSEIATQLVRRINNVLHLRQLAAPGLDAEGLGRDANSVAEYLDNTLDPDQIPDFERICLESDAHLGEVAACHQILTLVLGEPASVPSDLKQKIYALDRVGQSAQTADAPAAVDRAESDVTADVMAAVEQSLLAPEPNSGPRRMSQAGVTAPFANEARARYDEDEHWTEAPDYLKRPRPSRWKPIAIAASITFCLVIAGLRGMGPFDATHPLARRFGISPDGAPRTADSRSEDIGLTPEIPADRQAATGAPDDSALEGSPLPPAGDERASQELNLSDASGRDSGEAPAADIPDGGEGREAIALPNSTDEADVTSSNQPGAVATTPSEPDLTPENGATLDDDGAPAIDPTGAGLATAANAGRPEAEANDVDPGNESEMNLGAVVRSAPATQVPDPPEPPALINPLANRTPVDRTSLQPVPALPNRPDPRSDIVPEQPEVPEDAAVIDVGRFLDPQRVLIKQDPAAGLWQRVTVGTLLQAGDTLMSLPTYRTPLALASGVQLNLIGATLIQVAPEGGSTAKPVFEFRFGRLTLATVAQADSSLGLRWGNQHEATLTLGDMDTTLAIELQRHRLPGTDPEQTPAHQVLQVYVTNGSAQWQAEDGLAIQITAGQRLTMVDDQPAQLREAGEFPDWIDGSDARPRDPVAAQEISRRLVPERPVTLVLQEEAESRRFEVRSLAVCSLAHLGDVAPLLRALGDAGLRSYWSAQYEVLTDVIAESPELAGKLHEAVVQRHGSEDGESLYRMLWGYSPAQLAEGGAKALVDALDHPSSDFRIVASEMLKSITGLPSLYRAHASERDPQRRTATVRWRRHLDNGEIVFREPPEIVQLLTNRTGNP